MSLAKKIKQLSEEKFNNTIANRNHLHQNPELSFEEYNTSAYIISKLDELGIKYEVKAKTGLTGVIQGNNPDSKVIALRADIDALPILEKNQDKAYRSQNEGVMHACGHDVHTSSLLGSLEILNNVKNDFNGSVKFIFQPGEEKIPGGASIMIKEGVLKNPQPKYIYGQHVMPLIDAGKVGFRKGMYMASADEIYIKVKGKGGHGAMPERNIDPIIITSHILVAMQQVVSRFNSPKMPTVLSFGKVIAEGATNVIPDEVYVEGTFRTFDEKWRNEAHNKIKDMAIGIAKSMGADCDIEVKKGYPFLKNDELLTERSIDYAKEYMGEENVLDLDLWLAAEDFSYYTQEMDACFYRLGIRNEEKGIVSGVHTPTFDIDEKALEVGPGLMAYLAVSELNNQ